MAAAALLVVLTSLVTGFLGTTLLRSYLLDRSDAQLRNFASVASRMMSKPDAPPRQNGQQTLPTQFLVEVVGADGTVQVTGGPLHDAGRPALSAAQLRDDGTPFTAAAVNSSGESWRVLVQPVSGGAHLVTAYSLDDLNSTVTRLEVADAIAGGIAIALLGLVGVPLVRASLAPLARIESTAAAIAGGDFSRRIDHPTGNTPLTSVQGLAEYGLQQGGAASQQELLRLMRLIARESGRMGRLVEDLLLLARLDAGRPLELRPTDLASIAAEAVQAGRVLHPDRPVTLVAAEPVIVLADDGRLRQVIDNLLSNAVKHTPDGAPVTVTVTSAAGSGELSVADTGPGLTQDQAARVFERFYRTDGDRGRARGGTGLGLAIAASLTAAHGGQIGVDTAPGRGATFFFRLPLATGEG
jgi:two-component system OmpR family sensor kinase